MKIKKCLVVICVLLSLVGCSKGTEIYKAYDEIIGEKYKDVVSELENQGFTNIIVNSIEDLDSKNDKEFECVKDITIDGKADFGKEKFSNDSEIIIIYHSAKQISLDFAPKNCRGKSYEEIVEKFTNLGFTNVKSEGKENDNELNSDEVYDVSIDGNTNFKEGDTYDVGSEVVVMYYQFVKDDCPFQYGAIQSFPGFSNYYLLDTENGYAYSWSDGQYGAYKGKLSGSIENGFTITYSSDWVEKLTFKGGFGEQVILTDYEGYTYDDFLSVKPTVIWKNNKNVIENAE